MIIFATKYDSSTEACYPLAGALVTQEDIALLDVNACRKNLIRKLSTHRNIPLFVMSHGERGKLIDQNRELALGLADTHLVLSRANFAFACHSATELGRAVAADGGIWWGYTGTISAPADMPECFSIFLPIFQYIVANFPSCQSVSDVQRFMRELKDWCDDANSQLDQLDSNDGLNYLEAYLCLLNIWDRLRVWLPGAQMPEMHPQVKPPITIID